MAKRVNPQIHNNFVDANFWDDSGNLLEDAAMVEILDLEQRGETSLILPFSVKEEIEHSNTPPEIKKQAEGMVYTLRTQLTPNELALRAKLLGLIQGNAKPGKHERDVYHLFESDKYGGGYFITKDTRLLRKAGEVERLLASLRIVSPSQFVKHFHSDSVRGNSRSSVSPVPRNCVRLSKGNKQLSYISYKGYAIHPAPLPLANGRWNHEVYVARDKGYEWVERKFSTATSFATQEEAIAHCITFGKQIIDGKVPNCSVEDLGAKQTGSE